MGLFGGGRLKAQVDQLSADLEAAKAELEAAQKAAVQAKKDAEAAKADVEEAQKRAKANRKKADKASEARHTAEKKAHDLAERVTHLEGEVDEFRTAMLDAKRELERARGRVIELERRKGQAPAATPAPAAEAPAPAAPAEDAPAADAGAAPPAAEERAPRRRDLERLESKLARVTEDRDGLRDKIKDAVDKARSAERKARSETQRAQTTLRDLQHNLKSERRAYKILQMQYEALIDRTRGLEQQVDAKVAAALEAHTSAAPEAEAPVVTAEAPKPLVEVVED